MNEPIVPDLKTFVRDFVPTKLPMNWHHELFYDILENRVIMKEDGKIYFNTFHDKNNKPVSIEAKWKIPDKINQNILMLAPRFHAKSQCFTINYPLWEIYRNHDVRIMIVSANEEIALSFNRAIMNNLENNHKLIDTYGYLVPQFQDKKKWGEKAIIVSRDTMEKDPTVVAVGVGGKLISRRADIIIIDDLIDLESARTKSARNKIREWFENVLIPILEDTGRLIIAGTSWYRGDIYDLLWQESDFDIRMKLKAFMYHEKYERKDHRAIRYLPYSLLEYPKALKAQDVFSEEIVKNYELYQNLKGGVLWQDKWSFEKLMKKKRKANMSMASFSRQYLNEPMSEEDQVFKDNFIKRSLELGNNKSLQPTWDNSNPITTTGYGHMIIAAGLDLAISKKANADNSAIAVWGLTEKRERVPLWLDYGKWSPDEIKAKVIEVFHNFNPVKIRVENVAYQDMMAQELALDVPVEGFHTTSGKKFNEETGLAHIAMLMEQDKLLLPSSQKNKDYYNKVKQLISEMSEYTYDQHAGDLLMASWFAVDVLRDFDKKLKDNRGYFSTNALVEQMKNVKAAHRVVILGYRPPVFKLAFNSLMYVFRAVEYNTPFTDANEPFLIFATRYDRSIAYIFNKQTNEMVAKIEGDLSAIMFASLLEKAGHFFNDAQIVVDKNGEGQAILLQLEQQDYRNLLVYQPGDDNQPIMEEGYQITAKNLPLAVDYFKMMVDGMHITIPDEQLVKEMGELIAVEGNELTMSFGKGQRIKTVASALWLLDKYENMEKEQLHAKKVKRKNTFKPRYRVFRH